MAEAIQPGISPVWRKNASVASFSHPMQLSTTARNDRLALYTVQLGAIAVVLAALPYKAFELDRYFAPKELVLYATATVAALACTARRRQLHLAPVDWLLAAFLVLSVVSAVNATNWWLAWRALAVSLAGAALFWVARTVRGSGRSRALVCGLVCAAVVGVATALAQAYGVESAYFSLNRSPGGTFGNRNFMAHLGAIVTPALLLCAVTARRTIGYWLSAMAVGVIAASQVLSRSRGAWLAVGLSLAFVGAGAWVVRRRWQDTRARRRLGGLAIAASIGVCAALLLPNALEWRSDSPYLDSIRGVVNYKEGSGHGRLVQYSTSLRMTRAHPILGVGPGNWGVVYPRYASAGDPSLDSQGMTANPWPSSDWVALLSERGMPAFMVVVLALVAIGGNSIRQLYDARNDEQIFSALALGGTFVATLVVGAFDAVLLLALPTLFVWTLFGALLDRRRPAARHSDDLSHWAPAIIFAIGAVAASRSALQCAAMDAFNASSRTTAIERAAQLDPGSYRIRMRLAESYFARGNCKGAAHAARDARRLFPNAPRPKEYLAACGDLSR